MHRRRRGTRKRRRPPRGRSNGAATTSNASCAGLKIQAWRVSRGRRPTPPTSPRYAMACLGVRTELGNSRAIELQELGRPKARREPEQSLEQHRCVDQRRSMTPGAHRALHDHERVFLGAEQQLEVAGPNLDADGRGPSAPADSANVELTEVELERGARARVAHDDPERGRERAQVLKLEVVQALQQIRRVRAENSAEVAYDEVADLAEPVLRQGSRSRPGGEGLGLEHGEWIELPARALPELDLGRAVDGELVARELEAHAGRAVEPLHVGRKLAGRRREPLVVDAEEAMVELRFRRLEAPALPADDGAARGKLLHELEHVARDDGARPHVSLDSRRAPDGAPRSCW